MTVVGKIMDALTAPFVVEENMVTVGASIGIAVYPEDGREAEVLIRAADAAMYRAKGLATGFALSM
jgi:diguanylate cyclase (GGDEF)-like protein